MEKFQSASTLHSHNQIPSITAIIAGLALSACTNTPPSHSYTPPREKTRIEYIPVYIDPPPTLISKSHTHKGPLGDKICTYTYSNKEKIRSLCNPKPDKEIKKYSKILPRETKYTPGKMEMKPGYGLKPDGKFGPTLVPQHTPWKYESGMPKTVYCTLYKTYNQSTGEASISREQCF